MPKPPPRTQPETPTPKQAKAPLPVSKTPPLAEIILFPNAKEVIAGVSEAQTDTHTKTRWLKLADEVLESGESPKKA